MTKPGRCSNVVSSGVKGAQNGRVALSDLEIANVTVESSRAGPAAGRAAALLVPTAFERFRCAGFERDGDFMGSDGRGPFCELVVSELKNAWGCCRARVLEESENCTALFIG